VFGTLGWMSRYPSRTDPEEARAKPGKALKKNWRSSEPQKLEGFEGTIERLIRGKEAADAGEA